MHFYPFILTRTMSAVRCVINDTATRPHSTIRYDTIEEINVDSKAEYQMQTQTTQPIPWYSQYTVRLMAQSGALLLPQLKLCDLLSTTHCLATMHNVTDDRQRQKDAKACRISRERTIHEKPDRPRFSICNQREIGGSEPVFSS